MLRKVVGFLVGFVGSFVLIVVVVSAISVKPMGPGWLFLMVGAGVWCSRLFARPKEVVAASIEKVSESTSRPRMVVSRVWWSLDPKLRLALVASTVWIVAAYSIQDDYERNVKVVLLPALAVIAFYFGHRFLVQEKS
ncbi:hypothetical protein [Citrifermentans bremense]|uniref:Uncharacterized protein n=1 Tax=Citrifermentans bremense TaxID=60035 RepID=A0A6S6M5U1_9BACT|nr:hypothetical protein [Citrifermentans bremense]